MSYELVSVKTADAVVLHGTLHRPASEAPKPIAFDCAILHHGASANFYGASPLFDTLGERLLAGGCAVLRVNSRGHDLLFNSPRGLLGSATEIVDDCRLDLRAWTDFAATSGFRKIAHWGHSLGALKSVYYLAKEQDDRVPLVVAISPPRFACRDFLALQGAESFKAELDHAMRQIDEGRPDELFAIQEPIRSIMSARTFVDKYGPEERYDVLELLPALKVPTLVTIGNESSEGPGRPFWFPFNGLVDKVAALAAATPNLSFVHIPAADHSYAGQTEAVWAAAEAWLGQSAPAPAAGR
jgi:alpha/beta hydrolase family protein